MPTPHPAQIVFDYFPALTPLQRERFEQLDALYREWNARINVISRRDIDNLYPHHVLHSLAIARAATFRPGTTLLDVGTGGGFPGIPLAILYPECHFTLIDSIGKKIRVVEAVAEALGLDNVTARHCNVIEERGRYDFVISRAVMDTRELVRLVQKNIEHRGQRNALPPGLLCLKGGDLAAELAPFRRVSDTWAVSSFFPLPFFDEKQVVYVQL